MKKLDNGQLKWLLGLYRTLIAAAMIGMGSILWASVQTTIRLEERIIALIGKIDKLDNRLTWLERDR